MKQRLFAILVGAACVALILAFRISPALGQQPPPCGPLPAVLDSLGQSHGEAVIAMGRDEAGNGLAIVASQDGKTWSALIVSPSGTACLVATGQDWRALTWTAPVSGKGT